MPAILRKLPSQNYASRCVLGLCGSYDQVGVRTTRSPPCGMVGGARVCEHYTMRSVSVANRPSGPPACVSTIAMLAVLYCPDSLVGLVGSPRPVMIGNGLQ